MAVRVAREATSGLLFVLLSHGHLYAVEHLNDSLDVWLGAWSRLLSFFLKINLCLDAIPVNLDRRITQELLAGLLVAKRLQVLLSERNDGVHVSLVIHCEFEGPLPVEEFDVHLDRSVD
eukprot:GEZU01009699.1.p1 GENE.GEZU01009699.1~~GEZU01009699.1.p1  ORF type:complete len:119 (+),score=9.88 GEZU01009699.1:47-403(+)